MRKLKLVLPESRWRLSEESRLRQRARALRGAGSWHWGPDTAQGTPGHYQVTARHQLLTSLERKGPATLEHRPEALARGGELALGHLHVVGDVLVEEALVAVLLLCPLAVLGIDQRNKVSLIALLPLGHTGHPLD